MKKTLLSLLVLIIINTNVNSQTTFTSEILIANNAPGARSIEAIDINNDGNIDVVVANSTGNELYWRENDGYGNFIENHLISNSIDSITSIHSADFDNDNDIDIVAVSKADSCLIWFENINQGDYFTAHILNNDADLAHSVFSIDLNNDNYIDIIYSHGDSLSILLNNGNKTFQAEIRISDTTSANSIYADDMNGDGKMDILCTDYWHNEIVWFKNTGVNIYISDTIQTSANNANAISTADFDGDGYKDILAITEFTPQEVFWYKNDGAGNFNSKHIIGNPNANFEAAFSADFDNDGDVDVVVSTYNYTMWYQNNGSGVFIQQLLINDYGNICGVKPADIDNDGDMDFFVALTEENKVVWQKNKLIEPSPCVVAYFPFNNNFYDESGNNYEFNNYTFNAVFTYDRFGNSQSSCKFDTSTDLSIESNTLNLNDDISFSIWLKIDTLIDDTNYVVEIDNATTNFSNLLIIITSDREILIAQDTIMSSTTNFTPTGQYIDYHKIHHIVVTKDASLKQFSLYLDNQLSFQFTSTVSQIPSTVDDDEKVYIGLFEGIADDVNIYRCVISPETIDSLYYVGGWDPSSCLVTSYLFNNNLNDDSGNNYNGEAYNTGYISFNNDRFNTPNSAINLTDSIGFITGSTIFNITDDMSLSFWLNIDTLLIDTTYISALFSFDNSFFNFLIAIDKNQNNLLFGQGVDVNGFNIDMYNSSYSFNFHENYHIVITRDETLHKLYIYINNELIDTIDNTTSIDYYLGQNEIMIWGSIDSLHLTVDDINLYRCKINLETIDSLYHVGNWNGDCLDLAISSLSINDASCGQANGTGFVSVSGGSGYYNYLWSDGTTTNIATSLEGGSNSIQISDTITGCMITQYFNVNNSNAPIISINSITNINCYGENNGEITPDVTGGTGSYIYNWSTGSHNTSISDLLAGTYELTIIDDANCIVSETFTISQPNELSVSFNTTNSDCNTANGIAEAIVTGGTPNYTYSWGTGTDTIMNLSVGSYPITITDANSCTIESSAIITDNGAPTITIDSIIAGNCNNDGAIYVSIGNATSPTFEWNGSTSISEDLDNATANTTHMLTVYDGSCTAMQDIFVPYILPETQEICIVTVDSTTGANLIVWEKPVTTDIKAYNIYRETSIPEEYVLIGSTPYDSLGVFVDDMAYPWIRSYKYKIASVDNCDVVSEMSYAHKTIHVNLNVGYLQNTVNLNWDDYSGFSYSTFHALRYDVGTGWNDVAGSPMPNNLHSITADVFTNTLMFAITVDKPGNACLASKVSGGPYSHSLSNLDDYGFGTSTDKLSDNNNIEIFPNPTNSILNIKGNYIKTIEITDTRGQIISKKEINANNYSFDMRNNAKGIYFIRIYGNDYLVVKKFVLK